MINLGLKNCFTKEIGLGLLNFIELLIYVVCLNFPFVLCPIQTANSTSLPQARTVVCIQTDSPRRLCGGSRGKY